MPKEEKHANKYFLEHRKNIKSGACSSVDEANVLNVIISDLPENLIPQLLTFFNCYIVPVSCFFVRQNIYFLKLRLDIEDIQMFLKKKFAEVVEIF